MEKMKGTESEHLREKIKAALEDATAYELRIIYKFIEGIKA